MRGEQHGTATPAELLDDAPQLPPRLRVQSRRRLVQEQQIRIAHERASNGQALPLPAGELAHPCRTLLLERDQGQYLVHAPAAPVEAPEQAHHLFHLELLGQLGLLKLSTHALTQLGFVAIPGQPQHFHLASVRLSQTLEDLDGRRFAGTIGTEHAEALTPAYIQVDAGHGGNVSVALH